MMSPFASSADTRKIQDLFSITPDIYEMDDTFDQAGIVTLNDNLHRYHNFHNEDDKDWIRFYGISGESYTIQTINPGPDCDIIIEIYDTDGLTVLAARDYGVGGEEESLDWTCEKEGIFYGKISHFPSGYPGKNTEYELGVFKPHSCFTGIVTGTVTDASSGEPLGGVLIKTDENDSAISQADGTYRLIACVSSNVLIFKTNGYETYTGSITVSYGESTIRDAVLTSARNLFIGPLLQDVDSFCGNTSFQVSNIGSGIMNWEAEVDPKDTWLSIESGKTGTNSGLITVSYAPNPGDARIGRIVVMALGATGSPQIAEVRQGQGLPADLSVKPENHDFGKRQVGVPARYDRSGISSGAAKRISPIEQLSSDYIENHVIIKMKNKKRSGDNQIQQAMNASVLAEFSSSGAQLWQISGLTVKEALMRYWNNPDIEYIEPDYKIHLVNSVPDDPDFSRLWGLHNTGQTGGKADADIDAPEAWDIRTGGNIVVAVIDTGVDYIHPDLGANMWTNPGEIPGNNVDDEGNGYIDDVHGYNFITGTGDPFDDNSHGTHCAGIIAGVGNNGTGIAGVNRSAKIMALKFISKDNYGKTSDAVKAIEYAVKMGVKISNNSWGGAGFSNAMYEAIQAAGDAGQIFMAAAGNDYGRNNDLDPHYPSGYDLDNIIAVASTDHNDTLSYFSNYGFTSVDLCAPGSDIYSTIPGNAYASYSGTSMATPHVAGVVSLVMAAYPELQVQEIKESILSSADKVPVLQGKTVTGGRLNAYASLMFFGRFSISNLGNRDLVIGEISLSGPDASDFLIKNDTCSNQVLPGYGKCSVKADFSPGSAGKKTAYLVIPSNDPDAPVVKVTLTGEGTTDCNLTLSKSGEGQVSANDMLCGQFPCQYAFSYGSQVTMEALPAGDFKNWSGDVQGNENPTSFEMNKDMNVAAVFKDSNAETWMAEIRAYGESFNGVGYEEWQALGDENVLVNSYKVLIGVGGRDESLVSPPAPPEYSVKMDLWEVNGDDWQGPYGKVIRKQGAETCKWIFGIDPHGNYPPWDARTSTIKWNPDQFDPGGYQLRRGYEGDGEIVVSDMRVVTEYDVTGENAVQFFTIEFKDDSSDGPDEVLGDLDGDRTADLKDVVLGLKALAGMNSGGKIQLVSDVDVNGDGRVGMEEVVYILQRVGR